MILVIYGGACAVAGMIIGAAIYSMGTRHTHIPVNPIELYHDDEFFQDFVEEYNPDEQSQ